MKRLLRISLNDAVFSFIPVMSWFALGLLVDKNLTNVFTLTYPFQFIWAMLKSIFGTGANISQIKDRNPHAVLSGLTVGSLVGAGVFGFIALHINDYIGFMNMDPALYRNFALYSVFQLFIQLVFALILEKLYFENREKLANKYCLIFNLLNFTVLIGSALLTKNQTAIIVTTLAALAVYVAVLLFKTYHKFRLRFNLLHFIKYNSMDTFNELIFFLIYLFGLSNALEYGSRYTAGITFAALITDTQWDAFGSIHTVAKIDICHKRFNYRTARRHAYRLLLILFATTGIMFATLYHLYELDLAIVLIFLGVEIGNFLIYPVYGLKMDYMQLEYSAAKTTAHKITSSLLRLAASFLRTPFCTGIGQVCAAVYQFVVANFTFCRHFSVKKGRIIARK